MRVAHDGTCEQERIAPDDPFGHRRTLNDIETSERRSIGAFQCLISGFGFKNSRKWLGRTWLGPFVARGIAMMLTLLFWLSIANAQEIMFAAQPDRTEMTTDETLKLTVSIFGRDVERSSEPELPPLPDFRMDTVFRKVPTRGRI